MKLFLSSEREFLPVVDAISLIAQHILDHDERPVPADDGMVRTNLEGRPAPNIAFGALERRWAALVRQAVMGGRLPLYDAEDFPATYFSEIAYVKPADLAQWLVDAGKAVVLDGVRVEPTPPVQPEILKRELLVERLVSIWPSIADDLQEGSRNWLMAAAGVDAKQYGRGCYDVQRALAWARAQGKLRGSTPTPLNDLPGMVYRF